MMGMYSFFFTAILQNGNQKLCCKKVYVQMIRVYMTTMSISLSFPAQFHHIYTENCFFFNRSALFLIFP